MGRGGVLRRYKRGKTMVRAEMTRFGQDRYMVMALVFKGKRVSI